MTGQWRTQDRQVSGGNQRDRAVEDTSEKEQSKA